MDPAIMMAVIAYFLAKKYDEERGQGSAPGAGRRPAGAPRGPLRELVSDTWRNGVNDVKGAADPYWQRRQLARSKAAADRLREIEENWRKGGQHAKADKARKEREGYEEAIRKTIPTVDGTSRPADPQSPPRPTTPDPTGPQGPEPTAPAGGTSPGKESPPTEEERSRPQGPETTPDPPTEEKEQEERKEQEPEDPPQYRVVVEDMRKRPQPVPEPRPGIEHGPTPELEAARPRLEKGPDVVDAEVVEEEPVVVPDTPAELVEADGDDWIPIGAGRRSPGIGPAGQEEIEGAVLTAPEEGKTMTEQQTQTAPGTTVATYGEGGSLAHIQFMHAYAAGLRNSLAPIEMIHATMGQYGKGPEVMRNMALIREHSQQLAMACQTLASQLEQYHQTMIEAINATGQQAATNTDYYTQGQ